MKLTCCCLVFNFVIYFFQRCWKKVAAIKLLRQPSCKCVRCCWQPSGKFVIAGQRDMQPSDKFLRGYWQLLQIRTTYLSDGCQYPLFLCQRVYWLTSRAVGRVYWITSWDICKRVVPVTKRGQPFWDPSENLKVKIKIYEATNSFNNYQRLIF